MLSPALVDKLTICAYCRPLSTVLDQIGDLMEKLKSFIKEGFSSTLCYAAYLPLGGGQEQGGETFRDLTDDATPRRWRARKGGGE